jgi:hypothetical protein
MEGGNMNWRVVVKVMVLLALMCAANWSIVPPKKNSPYASAVEVVSVKKAWAACGTKCSAPQFAVCLSAPPNKKCNNSGQFCQTSDCIE